VQKYGIYEWVNTDGDVVYIGSTSKWYLSGLEENHRQWKEKGYSWTAFREALVTGGQQWTVRWAQEPKLCTKRQIEIEEGALIRYVKPYYNRDMDPYASSVKHNRYEELQ
jgi:hypothetical protein